MVKSFPLTTISSCLFTLFTTVAHPQFSPVIDFSWPSTPNFYNAERHTSPPTYRTNRLASTRIIQILYIITMITIFRCSNFEGTRLFLMLQPLCRSKGPGRTGILASWLQHLLDDVGHINLQSTDGLSLRPRDPLWRVWQILPSKICNLEEG